MSKVNRLLFITIVGIISFSTPAKVLTGRFPKNFAHLREDLSKKEVARIKAGLSLFAKPWVKAPSSTHLRNGLGPNFNAVSCMSCHLGFGRGAPAGVIHPLDPSLLFKVMGSESPYGSQIQDQSIQGVTPEARVVTRWEQLPNGLTKPHYLLSQEQFGPLREDQFLSPRIAPHLAGLGYLDQISDNEILKNQTNGGKAHMINGRVGRFGWKADKIDLRHQVAAAFQGDLGITSSQFPEQPCTSEQHECLDSPSGVEEGHQFEISEKHLNFVVELMAGIEKPKRQRERLDINSINRGEKIFNSINCQSCHRADYELEDGTLFSPYTDLLLHDMGDELADTKISVDPLARQWRTPPLWGLGSQKLVNGHLRLLHDGRANGVEEAILWHGGEANESRLKYGLLSINDKADLINFILSL